MFVRLLDSMLPCSIMRTICVCAVYRVTLCVTCPILFVPVPLNVYVLKLVEYSYYRMAQHFDALRLKSLYPFGVCKGSACVAFSTPEKASQAVSLHSLIVLYVLMLHL